MSIYKIKTVDKTNIAMDDKIWDIADVAEVNCYQWDKTGYKPDTKARVLKGADGLYVRIETDEYPLVGNYKNYNDMVCCDSCMEFFLNAAPSKTSNYINIEINVLGTLYTGFGANRETSRPIVIDYEKMGIETVKLEKGWKLKYLIPNSILEEYFGETETNMKGNFYKCCEDEKLRHHGTWNRILWEQPDYHRPEFFGDIIVE